MSTSSTTSPAPTPNPSASKSVHQEASDSHHAQEDLADPFDALLTLETTYEASGYTDGLRDGQSQARVSARLFGIEKASERWETLGRIRCKAIRWAGEFDVDVETGDARGEAGDGHDRTSVAPRSEPVSSAARPKADHLRLQMQKSERARRHVVMLLRLTDPSTLSSANDDDAIGDFDERMKRAAAKVRVLERLLGLEGESGEDGGKEEGQGRNGTAMEGDGDIENPRLNIAALNSQKGVGSESLGTGIE